MKIKPSLVLSAMLLCLAFAVLTTAVSKPPRQTEPWLSEIDPERYVDLYNYQALYRDVRLDRLISESSSDRRITLEEEARIINLITAIEKERDR